MYFHGLTFPLLCGENVSSTYHSASVVNAVWFHLKEMLKTPYRRWLYSEIQVMGNVQTPEAI